MSCFDGDIYLRKDYIVCNPEYGIPLKTIVRDTIYEKETLAMIIENIKIAFDFSIIPVSKGGTNLTSYNQGDILYASSANVLSALAKPGVDSVLKNTSAGAVQWVSLSGLYQAPTTFTNGITATGSSTVTSKLGGALTENTSLSGGFSFSLLNTGAAITFNNGSSNINLDNTGFVYVPSATMNIGTTGQTSKLFVASGTKTGNQSILSAGMADNTKVLEVTTNNTHIVTDSTNISETTGSVLGTTYDTSSKTENKGLKVYSSSTNAGVTSNYTHIVNNATTTLFKIKNHLTSGAALTQFTANPTVISNYFRSTLSFELAFTIPDFTDAVGNSNSLKSFTIFNSTTSTFLSFIFIQPSAWSAYDAGKYNTSAAGVFGSATASYILPANNPTSSASTLGIASATGDKNSYGTVFIKIPNTGTSSTNKSTLYNILKEVFSNVLSGFSSTITLTNDDSNFRFIFNNTSIITSNAYYGTTTTSIKLYSSANGNISTAMADAQKAYAAPTSTFFQSSFGSTTSSPRLEGLRIALDRGDAIPFSFVNNSSASSFSLSGKSWLSLYDILGTSITNKIFDIYQSISASDGGRSNFVQLRSSGSIGSTITFGELASSATSYNPTQLIKSFDTIPTNRVLPTITIGNSTSGSTKNTMNLLTFSYSGSTLDGNVIPGSSVDGFYASPYIGDASSATNIYLNPQISWTTGNTVARWGIAISDNSAATGVPGIVTNTGSSIYATNFFAVMRNEMNLAVGNYRWVSATKKIVPKVFHSIFNISTDFNYSGTTFFPRQPANVDLYGYLSIPKQSKNGFGLFGPPQLKVVVSNTGQVTSSDLILDSAGAGVVTSGGSSSGTLNWYTGQAVVNHSSIGSNPTFSPLQNPIVQNIGDGGSLFYVTATVINGITNSSGTIDFADPTFTSLIPTIATVSTTATTTTRSITVGPNTYSVTYYKIADSAPYGTLTLTNGVVTRVQSTTLTSATSNLDRVYNFTGAAVATANPYEDRTTYSPTASRNAGHYYAYIDYGSQVTNFTPSATTTKYYPEEGIMPEATVDIGGGGAKHAPFRIRPGVKPTNPNEGDMYYDNGYDLSTGSITPANRGLWIYGWNNSTSALAWIKITP
jgi:hypothetical protein